MENDFGFSGNVWNSWPFSPSDSLLLSWRGFGRFGHIVGRVLNTRGVETPVLDLDAERVELVTFRHTSLIVIDRTWSYKSVSNLLTNVRTKI